jgi:uncharacterized membrane protein
MTIVTLSHMGIILIFIGTVILACSVKSQTQYDGNEHMMDCVRRHIKDGGVVPTYTYIDKKLYYIGLACIGIGSLLQW